MQTMYNTQFVSRQLGVSSALLRQYVRALESAGYTFHRVYNRDLLYTDADLNLLRTLHTQRSEQKVSILKVAFASQQKMLPAQLYPSNVQPRECRVRVHLDEWLEDLQQILQAENGQLSGSMADIASKVGCAVSTLKDILKKGDSEGIFTVESKCGRNGSTTITAITNASNLKSSNPIK